MIKKIKARIKALFVPGIRCRVHKTTARLEKLGTDYGGWIIPIELIDERSVCYLAGAGEDISFDTLLAKRVKCDVLIFDPTPRAKAHFDKVVASVDNGQPVTAAANWRYDMDAATVALLKFRQIGIWKQSDTVKFFAPADETHVSHSISNLQSTANYFEAKVEKLTDIMRDNGHQRIDLLKLDIEGAEYDVIDSILEEKVPVRILCIEFHPGPGGDLNVIRAAIRKLEENGYQVIARENLDLTFIKKQP
jgi:FkbM family methyltransferase